MGQGVRVVSSEPVKNGGFEGVKAIFAFDDISHVQVSQNPDVGGGPMSQGRAKGDDPVTFSLTRQGGTAQLTVAFNDRPMGADAAAGMPSPRDMPDLSSPMMMNMLKSMFEGFRLSVAIEPIGTIVKTNAEYVSGTTVTLIEMDMAALLADEARFKALTGTIGPGASLSSVKPYLKDIKGIKIDGPVVRIEFK
jgi:hypothetical protein